VKAAQVIESATALAESMNGGQAESAGPAYLTRARLTVTLALMGGGLVIIAVVASAFGTVHISMLRAARDAASPDRAILMSVRLPRVLIGAAVGAILAAVGAALQALVRNPLAEGGILGISGGGAMGAIIAMVAAAKLGGGEDIVPMGAFAAALLSTFAVYRISLVRGRLEPFTLLLAGVIFNAFWGAAIMLVNSVVNFFFVRTIIFWLMGSFEAPTWREVAICTVVALGGGAILIAYARDLNLLSLGDEEAGVLGVNVERLRRTIFIVTSLMIGVAVSVSGIITFVGLIVPHILRMTLGADHRLLLPASIIGGAGFTIGADLMARTIIAPAELPVGAITALFGGPFFIFVLRREGRRALGF
jgi:iron complex transport system permease protein